MRTATDLLSQYAAYHRDRRNIVSHLIGVPMIVFAIGVLLARPSVPLAGFLITPAWVIFALAAAWYLTRGSVVLGLAVTVVVGLRCCSAQDRDLVDRLGRRNLIVGWVIQLSGTGTRARSPRSSTTCRPACRPDVHRRRGDVRAGLEPTVARRDRAPLRPDVPARPGKIA